MVETRKSIERREGLTLVDLREFLAEVDAMEEIPPDAVIIGRVRLNGRVRRLEVDSQRRHEPPTPVGA